MFGWNPNGTAPGQRDETSRVRVAADGMAVDVVELFDAEAIEQAHVYEVKLAVRQERAGAHAVADSVGKERRVGLLVPALWAEDVGVAPHIRVYSGQI